MAGPLGELKYLYVGTQDFERDLAYYRDTVGAEVVWNFREFGARVAALRLGAGPLFLLADHRPAPTCMLVYAVEEIDPLIRELKKRGWKADAGPFEIPDGPCYTFRDPSGNPLAVFQNDRPNALQRSESSEAKPARTRARSSSRRL